jgi:hypothetical protein
MMSRTEFRVTSALVLAACLATAVPGAAQGNPPAGGAAGPAGQRPEATVLVYEREVFSYPAAQRRNPFVSLLAAEGGVRYQELGLVGIFYDEADPSESLAMLGRASSGGGGTGISGSTRGLRVGESWGEVRVVEIRPDEIVVEVVVLGTVEQRVMRTPTRGQGGS